MSVSEQIEVAVELYLRHNGRAPTGVALNDSNYWRLKSELYAKRWHNMNQLPDIDATFSEIKQMVINTHAGSLNIYKHDASEPLILLHV
jgi:hypothetical protein